jgi:BASS family bile acid:Na+ symporter
MEQTVLAKIVLPIALFVIMLGMGLALALDDFRRVAKFPKAFAVGLACQMLLLPLIGFAVVELVGMDKPELAVGLMVLTFCPGGTTSNLLSYLARGDVALSISLTAVVSVITPFTIPLFTGLAMTRLMGASQAIAMPLGRTIAILLAITVLPVSIGMLINKKAPAFARRADKPVKVLSVVFLFGIIAGLIKQNWAALPGFFAQTGVAALLLNVISMSVGFGVARLARLGKRQQITVGMEVGIQNGTTALLVTGTLLANPVMTIAPAIYSLIMFGTGAVFGYLVNLGGVPDEATGGASAEVDVAKDSAAA